MQEYDMGLFTVGWVTIRASVK